MNLESFYAFRACCELAGWGHQNGATIVYLFEG